LVAGIDCAAEHSTFGEWALSSAKRTIVEMAIRELKPRSHHAHSPSSMTAFHYTGRLSSGPDRHFELETILALEHFERFVFVMSVLERYSEHKCALLLECSVSEIREARPSAVEKLIDSLHMVFPHNQVCTQETK
jgi:DNA-directed RNA polymerase specialized sigma24 family protein